VAGLPVLPRHGAGLAVGLFGGSFNPAHAGHRLASLIAMRQLGLDRVWWIVTPGNPLKNNTGLPPLAVRMEQARAIARHPRIDVTGFEAEIGTRYSYDTVAYLKRRCPDTRFVWIMGADNLRSFHRWQQWRRLASLAPFAVIDRPGSTWTASRAPAAIALAGVRLRDGEALSLAHRMPPAWIFLYGPRSPLSSTALRAQARVLA
jgi:nicotinate-nucleotide adenylyltransferase